MPPTRSDDAAKADDAAKKAADNAQLVEGLRSALAHADTVGQVDDILADIPSRVSDLATRETCTAMAKRRRDELAKAAADDAKVATAPAADDGAPTRRLVCTMPGMPTEIDGIGFATVQIGARTLHVSTLMSEKKAERLLSIDGFVPFTEDEGEHGARIDQAVKDALAPKVGDPKRASEIELRETVENLNTANLTVSKERNELRARNEKLVTENQRLAAENAGLKARLGQA